MISSFIQWASQFFLGSPKTQRILKCVIFIVSLAPILILGAVSYTRIHKELTQAAYARRQTMASLSAAMAKEKLDGLKKLGLSLATRVKFRELISAGKWDEAIKILEAVPKDFPEIERVFLTDITGTETADYPRLTGGMGSNFAFRDWYKGVTYRWEPYVSEVYRRTALPQYNLIAIAIPIKADDQRPLGILVLQITMDTFVKWSKEIEVGEGGFIYFVDRNGNVIAHPKFPPQNEIVNFSSVPVVQKVLQGENGIGVFYNPIERETRLSAYEFIPEYQWGVIVQQPAVMALALRDNELRQILIVYGIIFLINCLLVYYTLRIINHLNDARQRITILLESIGDGVVAIDRAWIITSWNKTAALITGYSKEEALGKPFREIVRLLRESDRKENITFIEEAMLFGKTRQLANKTILITKSGAEIPVGDSAAPIFDSNNQIIGGIIIFRDVSAERETQRMKSDFTYASHQLRTPVNRALWALESSLSEKSKRAQKENLQEAYQSLQSVHKFTEQIITVSEIDQKLIVPKIESANLLSILETVLKQKDPKIQAKQVKIHVAPISPIVSINTDKELFTRVLAELLDNAIEYSYPKKEVHVKIYIDKTFLIEIKDFGIGIPTEQSALAFTKFFRAFNIPQDSIGSGLGLYICKEYIKLLNGKIWFDSEKNKGTTFSISLPI